MKVLAIGQDEVRRLLPMGECIEVMAEALAALGSGDGLNPLRSLLFLPDRTGLLGMMPSYLGTPAAIGIKVVTVFPGNHGTPFDSHQGAVLLFEVDHGSLLAVVEASEITAIRTAAVSGLATRLLAREEASSLALLGSGVQARTHLEAMLAVRPVSEVRVWSRSREHAEAFAATAAARHGIGVTAVASAQEAVSPADLVCTTTAAAEPILAGEWLAAGTHVNAVGSSIPTARELDSAAVVRSRLFVDRRESTLNEAGDFLFPQAEGAIDENHIQAEIGELLLGQHSGRSSPDEITLFKSLGLAVEDLAAAHYVYRQALATGAGTPVPFTVDLGDSRP
ncbi:MAG: ornithine cyclodeaminase family protein [Acidobacteria bacterium]|nr:ornithine cyclodeaminase family protein [Acidobacteriota bacterium]